LDLSWQMLVTVIVHVPAQSSDALLCADAAYHSCQALGLMEVRTVLATLLGRFWFELAPVMGKPDAIKKAQQIALTLKMKEGLKLLALPHGDKQATAAVQAAAGGCKASGLMGRASSLGLMGRSRSVQAPAGPLN